MQQTPIGVISDIYTRNESTAYGAYASLIYKLRVRAPNAKIVLITPNNIADHNVAIELIDYIKVILDVGRETSCPVIDVYGKSGINRQQINDFTSDGVHPSLSAGKKIAYVVNAEMIQIHPN